MANHTKNPWVPEFVSWKKQHPNFLFSKSTFLTFQSAAKNDALIELSWICLYEITRQLGFDFRGPSPEPVVWRPASLRQWNGGEMVQESGRSEGNGGFRSPKLSEAQAVGRRSPVVQGGPVFFNAGWVVQWWFTSCEVGGSQKSAGDHFLLRSPPKLLPPARVPQRCATSNLGWTCHFFRMFVLRNLLKLSWQTVLHT